MVRVTDGVPTVLYLSLSTKTFSGRSKSNYFSTFSKNLFFAYTFKASVLFSHLVNKKVRLGINLYESFISGIEYLNTLLYGTDPTFSRRRVNCHTIFKVGLIKSTFGFS